MSKRTGAGIGALVKEAEHWIAKASRPPRNALHLSPPWKFRPWKIHDHACSLHTMLLHGWQYGCRSSHDSKLMLERQIHAQAQDGKLRRATG